MSRILLPFIVAAAVLTGCANGETADSGVATENCLYIVKYEGRMMKWHSCDEPPAMMTKRVTKRS
jgi:hypothetical protein